MTLGRVRCNCWGVGLLLDIFCMSFIEAIFDKVIWVTGKLIVIAGAVILVLTVVLGLFVWWLVREGRQNRAEEAIRQAACQYVPSVIVEIGDHVVELPARFKASFVTESGKAIRPETPSDVIVHSDEEKRFCLDGPQEVNLPVTRFGLGYGGQFERFAQEHQFPGRWFDVKFYSGRPLSGQYGPPESDPLTGNLEEMVIYKTLNAGPRQDGFNVSAVTQGVSEGGYRSSASCHFWKKFEGSKRPAKWTCEYRIRDLKTGLNYSYAFSELFQEELDLKWVAEQSELIVGKLRWLLAELSVEAPEK